jgi:hypothetical protein
VRSTVTVGGGRSPLSFGKHRMFRHRLVFVGAWLAITIALVAFPGFEARGLARGLIIGWWPFAGLHSMLGHAVYLHPLVELLVMFLLSGASVGMCAWLLDAACLSKRVWIALLVGVIVGAAASYASNSYRFEDWKRSPAVSAAMESPEVNYQPAPWDYHKTVVIPRTLAGGLWGLYVAGAAGFLFSAAMIVFRKRHLPTAEGA